MAAVRSKGAGSVGSAEREGGAQKAPAIAARAVAAR